MEQIAFWSGIFGGILALVGLAGIIWSIVAVRRARAASASDEDLKQRLQKIIPLNVGALMLSFLGLGLVVVGAILG